MKGYGRMSEFIKNFVEWGEEFIKPFKNFIENNHGNPILWIVLLFIGIGLFAYTYGTLNKNG